jgi:hypothetical protein
VTSSSVQKKDRDGGNNAQRDEDEERDPHANREAVGKRGLTGWDSHEPREPFVEFRITKCYKILVLARVVQVVYRGKHPH